MKRGPTYLLLAVLYIVGVCLFTPWIIHHPGDSHLTIVLGHAPLWSRHYASTPDARPDWFSLIVTLSVGLLVIWGAFFFLFRGTDSD
jgi:hypothetical protein